MGKDGSDLAQLEATLANLEATRALMDDAASIDSAIESVRARIARHIAESAGDGEAVAEERGAPKATDRSVVVEGDAHGNVFITGDGGRVAARDAPPPLLYEAYLASLGRDCGALPMAVIERGRFSDQRAWGAVSLPEIFVEPALRAHERPESAEKREEWGMRLIRGEGDGEQAAFEALAGDGAARAVVLGDQGTGKTTLGHRLCQQLAAGARDGAQPLPESLAGLVPLRFVLREAAATLPKKTGKARGSASLFWNLLDQDLARWIGDSAAPALAAELRRRIAESGAFVLLDGLDEVPTSEDRRRRVLEAVTDLSGQLAAPSRLMVTARPYAYQDPALHLGGFPVFTLAPFDQSRVVAFVEQWYRGPARKLFVLDERQAEARSAGLISAIDARPDLGDLASRPLLLMLMATLHSSDNQLPEGRAGLFEEISALLLKRWQQNRETFDRDGQSIQEPGLAAVLQTDEAKIRQALERLAFESHERQRGREPGDGTPVDIEERDILLAFKPLLGPLEPDALIAFLRDRAGLLIERRTEVFAFPHRAFQEFLAACHLGRQPESAVKLASLVRADPLWWREVALFSIARSFATDVDAGIGRIDRLVPEAHDSAKQQHDDRAWQTAVIASLACVDLGLRAREKEHPYGRIVGRCRGWMRAVVEQRALDPKARHEAGDLLSRLGDERPGVGTRPVEVGKRTVELPSIEWVEVPAGRFWMGSDDDDELAFDWEKPQHEVDLPRFWIAKFPVTNAQFRPFAEGGGYEQKRWWSEAGWAWRQGLDSDLELLSKDWQKRYREWFARRPKQKRGQPYWWNHPTWGLASRPVVGVTWYEAMAYACWLHEHAEGIDLGPIPGGRSRLPTEAEWEKAARGSDRRRWPWGNAFIQEACNSEEAGLGQTSAVGLFAEPEAKAPADVAGNVWEWTSSAWGKNPYEAPEHGYPVRPGDGREERDSSSARIVRGGSWYDDKQYVRCAFRFRILPVDWINFIGFRLVFSLAES